MHILAIDTCLQSCSVALLDGDSVVATTRLDLARGHAEKIAPLVADTLKAAKVQVADLDRVAVTIGPGSFTGVRVGIAFARGLAIGQKLDVVGVTTLQGLAAELPDTPLKAVAIDARRGQVYAQAFEGDKPLTAPLIESPEKIAQQFENIAPLKDMVWAGSGASLVYPTATALLDQPSPSVIARIGAKLNPIQNPPDAIYLRAPDAAPGKPLL